MFALFADGYNLMVMLINVVDAKCVLWQCVYKLELFRNFPQKKSNEKRDSVKKIIETKFEWNAFQVKIAIISLTKCA